MRMNISITPDTRYKNREYLNMIAQVSWTVTPGVHRKKKVYPRIKVLAYGWDFKKSMVKGNTAELVAVRDRIYAIKDFVSKLDGDVDENLNAILVFLGMNNEYKQIKLITLTDYINEFIRLHEKRYSRHSIRKYSTLIKNLAHFKKHSGLTDSFHAMAEDKQIVYFSAFVDFLLFTEIFDENKKQVKKLYENGSAKEQFKLIKSVSNKFKSTGIKVTLAEFADYLKEGKTQGTYCPIEEVREIYKTRNTIQDLPIMEQKAADLFLFQVFTGFRYNELKHVTTNSISIKISGGQSFKSLNNVADKEGLENSVPLTVVCQEVIDRWEGKTSKGRLLPVLSEFQYNTNLHLFLERIPMMHRMEKRVRYRGNDRVEEEIPRYKTITSHAGRHSYSHLLSLGGIDIGGVSQLMNHASPDTTNKNYKHILEEKLQYQALNILDKAI